MVIRPFQIVVLIISAIFLYRVIKKYIRSQVNLVETALGILFWVSTLLLALFPDTISNKLAKIFGIKDNINAVIFILIGFLGIIQFRLFNILRTQEKTLTSIIRKLAILEHDIKKDEDSLRS
ncbi:MAG: DUF2304 domain-containing protein [Saprospiraceae bacterium]|nr:DUF2304 domain-containing protein [Saprospiraceae bacterium]